MQAIISLTSWSSCSPAVPIALYRSEIVKDYKGWLVIAKTTFTFPFSNLTLPNVFISINNREMKSESGFSLAMASQPL